MSKQRAKGTAWESEVVTAIKRVGKLWKWPDDSTIFEGRWPHVERRALQGVLDKGDISGIPNVMIECKSERAFGQNLAQYAKEVEDQTRNANASIGVAWIKRPRKARAEQGYVVMSGDTFLKLLAEAGY